VASSESLSFESFVEETANVASAERLFELFTDAMRHLGYDRVNVAVAYDRDLPADAYRVGLMHTYPPDWQAYYAEQGCDRIDPVLKAAAFHDGPFRWAALEREMPLTREQIRFMHMSEEAGLNNGVAVPLRGANGQIAGIALATSERVDAAHPSLDLIHAYCAQFYRAYKRHHAPRPSHPNITLTPKEIEILVRAAGGKTDDDIAGDLGISRNTVDSHMRHIFLKLDVNSRVTASVKGIVLGLIKPSDCVV
jgi:DNA-binding CsgD family transcriptional regulator